MKSIALFLSIFTASAGLLSGQSILTFARNIELVEMRSTGIALVNPDVDAAGVMFTLFSPSGSVVGDANLSIPPGGQFAMLANEIFPDAPGGWVQVTSNVAALRGFWVSGDFVSYADGAEAAPSASDLVIPLITDLSDLTIINTGATEGAVLIRLFGQQGQELDEPVVRILPPKGSFRSRSLDLFDPPDWSVAGHVEVTSSVALAASVTARNYRVGPSLVALNGVGASASSADLIFSHVVSGRLGENDYASLVSVTNVSAEPQEITLTFFPQDGAPRLSTQVTLAGKATLRMSAQRMFGFSGFQNGWVRATSPLGLIGFAINSDNENGGSTATPGARSQRSLLFGHIANLSPWWTGLSLVNPGLSPATVEIIALAPDGAVIGSTIDFIPASGKTTRLLSEWIPEMEGRTVDGGYVYVRSESQLCGLALFFTRDLQILSSVPALDVAPTVTFNPGP